MTLTFIPSGIVGFEGILFTLLRNTHALKGKLGGSWSKQDEDSGG